MEKLWVFLVEDLDCKDSGINLEALHAFTDEPLKGDLLHIMGEHSGINLKKELKQQSNYLEESMSFNTKFIINNFVYTLHVVGVD